MNEINGALHSTQESFLFSLNKSNSVRSILSQNSIPFDYTLQRGPRYRAYAQLRESKLRFKQSIQQQEEIPQPLSTITPPKKRVTFHNAGGNPPTPFDNHPSKENRNRNVGSSLSSSVVARSVPDFAAVLRKENRRPASNAFDVTPPSSKSSPSRSRLAKSGGSRSAGEAEKRAGGGGLMGRKSCASIEELKGIASGVASAISGAGRTGRVVQKTVLGSRHFY